MSILSKANASNVDIHAMASSDPVSLLDGVIHELEVTRAAAKRASAAASPREQLEISAALVELESKLTLAHQKRDEVRARVARTARIRELSAEMVTLRAQSEAASTPGARDEARLEAVKNRIEEIRNEAQALAAQAR